MTAFLALLRRDLLVARRNAGPLRFLAAELVREAAFVELSQELPYSTAVEIQDFDESDSELVRIRANLVVERRSQKGMVIGQGGSMIKRIGVRARKNIEDLLQTKGEGGAPLVATPQAAEISRLFLMAGLRSADRRRHRDSGRVSLSPLSSRFGQPNRQSSRIGDPP